MSWKTNVGVDCDDSKLETKKAVPCLGASRSGGSRDEKRETRNEETHKRQMHTKETSDDVDGDTMRADGRWMVREGSRRREERGSR
jgi:hypothetical protein